MENGNIQLKIRYLTQIALMSAVICILGPVVIPIGTIPISFTGIGVYLSLFLIGKKKAVAAVCVYLLLGMAGLPVFSGFSSGLGKLMGPTGGYLVGFLFSAYLSGGLMEEKRIQKKLKTEAGRVIYYFIALFVGNLSLYLLGSLWLSYTNSLSVKAAFQIGVLPFIVPDFLKNIIVISLGRKIMKRIRNVEML